MRPWNVLIAALLLPLAAPTLLAQPTVEELQREVAELKELLKSQEESFESRLDELEAEVTDQLDDQLENRIQEIVATKSMFFARPNKGRTDKQFLFDTLEGGLVFTGLFRSRVEYRNSNIDFNRGGDGIDDEGVRVNGRFRLGFGAVLLGEQTGSPTHAQISVLTEFQAVGTFANNSFVNVPGPGGVSLPTGFNILTEPFEEVALYQGYLHFERLIHENVYIKAGRQEMTFGNEFVLGNNSFYDGTVHDALLFEWVSEGLRISAFYAKQAASDKNLVTGVTDFDEDQFAGIYGHFDVSDDLHIEAYALYFDARSIDTDLFVTGSTAFFLDGAVNPFMVGHFWTFGARAFWSRIRFLGGTLSLNGELAFQTGSNRLEADASTSVTDQSIHGWAAEFIANLRLGLESQLQPIVTLGFFYSGGGKRNDDGGNGVPLKHIGFQPLFVNRHFDLRDRNDESIPYYPGGGRYGNMDIVPLSNVLLAKAAVSIAPSENTELGLAYVLAITADDEGYGTGIFGHEIDVFGSLRYNDKVTFSANVSVFFPGRTAKDLSNFLFFSDSDPRRAERDMAIAVYLQALIQF